MPLLYAACQSFLSTLSLRRATMYGIAQTNTFKFLSTLSLRRATNCKYAAYVRYGISIHALLAESDALRLKMPRLPSNFYPRSPCGERLLHAVDKLRLLVISIHALLAESDSSLHSFVTSF